MRGIDGRGSNLLSPVSVSAMASYHKSRSLGKRKGLSNLNTFSTSPMILWLDIQIGYDWV